ncbi:MAG: polysaccharide deacetylase family protein [Bacteroidales bacterium]|jgi:peptidoglycan/xylan/chitin deacetylase (PgdA/CDA1 family)|nr:polysaccharide deacetylase family protein [Bacteroidales bacterium]
MLKSLIKISNKRLLLPLYHAVNDDPPAHLKNLYPVRSFQQFKADIEFFLKYYDPIDSNTLVDLLKNDRPIRGNRVLFTFDDGLQEIKTFILPLLKQKGIPALFFVNPAFVDNKDLFYRYKASIILETIKNRKHHSVLKSVARVLKIPAADSYSIRQAVLRIDYPGKDRLDLLANLLELDFSEYLKKNMPYLTTPQLKAMQNDQFALGAHSIDHPEFYNLSLDEQLNQATQSMAWVQKELNPKNNFFAFPFTDFNVSAEFFETLYSDYTNKPDLTFGCAGLKDEFFKFHIQRVPFEIKNSSAKATLKNEYFAYLIKKMIRRNFIKR